jgi:glycosyltransferase involved in cell wall biosynthesis
MYPSKMDPLFGVFVKNFKELLRKQGVEFSASSVINGKRTGVLKKALTYSKYYLSITKNHFFKKFDLRYVHYLTHNSPILYLLNFLNKKSPLVVNVHGSDILDSQGKFINKINIKVLKKTDLVITPSQYFKEIMLNFYPFLKPEDIFVSPSGGIDTSKFYYIETKKNALPTMGLISRIDEGKGWDDFLKALDILNRNGFNFKVKIAGQGLQEGLLKQMILDFKLSDKVTFLGLINQNELIHLYNEIDVMVFPTKREAESLGLVGLEAMSCKTPVIGSNIAGLKTYIEEGYNGFLFEPSDFVQLSETIDKFFKLSETEKQELSKNALETSSKYEAKNIANILKNKLSELC